MEVKRGRPCSDNMGGGCVCVWQSLTFYLKIYVQFVFEVIHRCLFNIKIGVFLISVCINLLRYIQYYQTCYFNTISPSFLYLFALFTHNHILPHKSRLITQCVSSHIFLHAYSIIYSSTHTCNTHRTHGTHIICIQFLSFIFKNRIM